MKTEKQKKGKHGKGHAYAYGKKGKEAAGREQSEDLENSILLSFSQNDRVKRNLKPNH